MEQASRSTSGLHHVGLTVHAIDEVSDFLEHAVGFEVVGEDQSYPARFLSDGDALITLWQVQVAGGQSTFDRKANVGLHHLALAVSDEQNLQDLYARIRAWPGVEVEFAPGPVSSGSKSSHFIVSAPGGIRFEFFSGASS